MSLKKKIILGFLTSSTIIAALVIFSFVSFIEIRKEIRYLELSDNLRGKSLQLRRHEKNFLLYGEEKEIQSVHIQLKDLRALLMQGRKAYKNQELAVLEKKIDEYGLKFSGIENSCREVQQQLAKIRPRNPHDAVLLQLVEATFLERPLVNAELLQKSFSRRVEDPAVTNLLKLHTFMISLRKDGEEILGISNELDRSARENVEKAISASQMIALIFFPLSFFVGLLALFAITHSIAKRLKILSSAIERTGKGDFSILSIPEKQDEVGVLVTAFNRMETALAARDRELVKKNDELLRSRKLASIGTLASGVAHELNNPLNNIYTTAQRLTRKSAEFPIAVRSGLDDIFSQTMRVKKIVGDLLEFAKGREPLMRDVELNSIIRGAYRQIANTIRTENITFTLTAAPDEIQMFADPEQIEQVFINLFTNAIDSMPDGGDLGVTTFLENAFVKVRVTDTGRGMSRATTEKIFEPFFTTKDKGTGLGLSIVFNIIQKHTGSISIESEEGKGTTFVITLPKGDI